MGDFFVLFILSTTSSTITTSTTDNNSTSEGRGEEVGDRSKERERAEGQGCGGMGRRKVGRKMGG